MSEQRWVDSAKLLQSLKIHRNHLLNLRKRGVLKAGTHYRNISPGAGRPTYRYNLKKCLDLFCGEKS